MADYHRGLIPLVWGQDLRRSWTALSFTDTVSWIRNGHTIPQIFHTIVAAAEDKAAPIRLMCAFPKQHHTNGSDQDLRVKEE